jgi:hypothetical protein
MIELELLKPGLLLVTDQWQLVANRPLVLKKLVSAIWKKLGKDFEAKKKSIEKMSETRILV